MNTDFNLSQKLDAVHMTFDDYNDKLTRIANELQAIADRTAQQALVGAADSANPMFVQLMRRHAQLVKLSSELTERMIALMGSDDLPPDHHPSALRVPTGLGWALEILVATARRTP